MNDFRPIEGLKVHRITEKSSIERHKRVNAWVKDAKTSNERFKLIGINTVWLGGEYISYISYTEEEVA